MAEAKDVAKLKREEIKELAALHNVELADGDSRKVESEKVAAAITPEQLEEFKASKASDTPPADSNGNDGADAPDVDSKAGENLSGKEDEGASQAPESDPAAPADDANKSDDGGDVPPAAPETPADDADKDDDKSEDEKREKALDDAKERNQRAATADADGTKAEDDVLPGDHLKGSKHDRTYHADGTLAIKTRKPVAKVEGGEKGNADTEEK